MHPYCIEPGADLSLAELSAARLDGDVADLGGAWVPCDAIDTPWLRAQTLATVLGRDLAAIGMTAAWVHGGVSARPTRIAVRRACARRLSAVMRFGVDYHDARLDPADAVRLGFVQVSSIVRTAVDIARGDRSSDLAVLISLDLRVPGTIDAALGWIDDHPGAPLVRVARPRLVAALRQEDVTRYTS